MRYVDKGIHESNYIPIILESGNSHATFTADIIAPAKYGDEKKTKNILVDIKSGTKKEYTIKINGSVNIPKPRVLMGSVASDIVVSGCPKSGHWSTSPCDKKTSTFNISVDKLKFSIKLLIYVNKKFLFTFASTYLNVFFLTYFTDI